MFAAVQGVGALVGGIGAGALYEHSLPALIAVTVTLQVVALLILSPVVRRPVPPPSGGG